MDTLKDWLAPAVIGRLSEAIDDSSSGAIEHEKDGGYTFTTALEPRKTVQITEFQEYSHPFSASISDSFTSIQTEFTHHAVQAFRESRLNQRLTHNTVGGVAQILKLDVIISWGGPSGLSCASIIRSFKFLGSEGSGIFGKPVALGHQARIQALLSKCIAGGAKEHSNPLTASSHVRYREATGVQHSKVSHAPEQILESRDHDLSTQVGFMSQLPQTTGYGSSQSIRRDAPLQNPAKIRASLAGLRASMSKADSVAPLDQLSILRRAGGNSSREGTSNGTEINVQPGRQPEHKPDFLGSDQNQLEQPRKETSDSVMIGITSQHENARSRGNIQQDTTRLGNKDTQASVKVGGLNVVPDLPEHQAHNNAVEDDPWEGMSHISESDVTIPREQMDLLQHAHSWVPAEPGRRPPVANIPIGILTALNEKADRRAQWEEAEAKKTDNIALPELPTGSGPQSELASSDSETELPWSSSPVSPRRANQLPPDSSAEEPAQRTVSRSSKQRPPDSGVEGPSENDVQSDKKTPPGSRAEDSKIVQGLEANAQLPEDGRGKTSKLHKSNILRNSRSPNCAEQLENHSPPAKRRRVATPFESPRVLSTPHVARSPQKTEVESSKNPRNEENKRPKSPSSARSAPQADESRVADFIVGSGESKSDPPSGKPYESSITRRHAAALPEVLQLRPTFIDMDRDFDSESSELETHLPEALGDDRESVHADHASSQISLSSIIQPRQNSLVQVERTPRAQVSKDTRAAAQVNTVRVSQEPGFLRKNTSDRRTRDASSDPMIQGTYSQGNPVNRSKLHQRLSAENNLDGSENHVEDRMVLCTAENQQEASPNGQGAMSQKSLRVSSVAKSLDMPAGEDAQKVTKRDDEELHQKRNSKESLHPPAKLKKHRTGVKVSRSFQFSQDHRQYQDPRLLAKRHRQDFFTGQADPTSHRPELDPFVEKVDSHSLEGQTVAKKQHSHPTEAAHVTKETDHQPTGPGLDVERPASPSPEKSSLDEAVDGKLPEASLFVEREESQSLEAEKRTEGMGSEVNLDTGLSRVDEGDPAADLVSTESDARTPESSLHLTTKRLLNDKITGSHRDVHSNMTSPAPEELEVSSTPSSAISQEPRMNRQSPTLSEPYTYVSPQPMTIFDSFKESYPDYTGTLDQFVGTCAYIEWLYQNDRMEHRALWDDFAVRHVLEFPDW
ncbi:MAG: hypothetical protein M4579_006802, partial [Chaenotheca gracillima]